MSESPLFVRIVAARAPFTHFGDPYVQKGLHDRRAEAGVVCFGRAPGAAGGSLLFHPSGRLPEGQFAHRADLEYEVEAAKGSITKRAFWR